MEKNCLVTKLKSSVQNDSLLKLGEIEVEVNNTFRIKSRLSIEVRCDRNAISLVDGGPYSNSVNITGGTNTYIYVSGQCKVYIPQYYINYFQIFPMHDINIKYVGSLNSSAVAVIIGTTVSVDLGEAPSNAGDLEINMCTINFNNSSYPLLNLVSFDALNNKQTIDIQDLISKAPVLTIYKCYSDSEHQIGTLEDFGNAKLLTQLYGFKGTGTIEGFVAAQRLASGDREARTTGTVQLYQCPNISFQGVTHPVTGFKDLSWTATTITFDGTTIEA